MGQERLGGLMLSIQNDRAKKIGHRGDYGRVPGAQGSPSPLQIMVSKFKLNLTLHWAAVPILLRCCGDFRMIW